MTYSGRTRVGWGRFATLATLVVLALWGAAAAGADPPVFTKVPNSVTLEATSPGGATHRYPDAKATDGAGNDLSSIVCLPASGSVFGLGSTSVTCSVTDTVTGDTATASFTVTVQDTKGPVLTLPGNITRPAANAAGAIVGFAVSASDAVVGPVPVSCTPMSGSTFALGSTTVSCTATDGTTSTVGTFVVTVSDTTAPTVSVSGPSSVTTTEPAGVAVTYTATVSDDVDASPAMTCSPPSGTKFAVGTTTVSCSSTDAAGNTGTATLPVTVTLIDNTAPVIVVPGPMNLTTTVPGGAIGTFAVTASDNADGALTPSCNPTSGSLFALGTTTVTCTAADTRGNVASASFPVNVTLVDTTAPVVTVPGSIIAEATSQAGAAVQFSASATDNIDGGLNATCSPASATTFVFGTTTVTCSATDTRGNAGSASFGVTVRDTTPPVVTAGSDRVVEANGWSGSNVGYDVSAADAIDGPLLPSAIDCAPASGALFGLGSLRVVCRATDSSGNVGTGGLTVTVVDTTPPTLSVPAPLRVSATAAGLSAADPAVAGFLGAARAADIADSSPRVSSDAPALFPLGTTTVTFAAVDSSGNRATRASTITLTTGTVSPSAQPDVVPPANVSGLSAQALNQSIRLRWRPPSDRDFTGVEVTRSTTTVGAESTVVYRGRATTFLDRRLVNGTEYRYVFVSVDGAGNRSFGVVVVAAPERQLLTAPAFGARVRVPPLLAWVGVSGASYYNVQVSRNGRKILSVWPPRNRFKLSRTWAFAARRERLVPGTYQWYVWPGLGAQRESRYGRLLGQGSFVVVR